MIQVEANPANAVLVAVDVQNAFAKAGGRNAARGLLTEEHERGATPAVRAIADLLTRARGARVPVIYIRSVRTHREPLITVFGFPKILAEDSWDAAIVDEVTPQPGDVIVRKYSLDAFFRTELDDVLARLVPDPTRHQAIVTGGAANVCAFQAVMGFHLRDYWTVVPVDALYGSEQGLRYAVDHFSSPLFPNVFLTRAELIRFSPDPVPGVRNLVPGGSG